MLHLLFSMTNTSSLLVVQPSSLEGAGSDHIPLLLNMKSPTDLEEFHPCSLAKKIHFYFRKGVQLVLLHIFEHFYSSTESKYFPHVCNQVRSGTGHD